MLQQERRNYESQEFMGQNTGKFMRIVFVHSEISGAGGFILILRT